MIIAFSKAGSGRCELHTFLHHRGLLSCKQHLSSGNTGGDSTSVPSWIYFQGSFTFHQQLSEWFTSGGHYGKVKNKHAPSQFPGTPPLSGLLFIYLAYLLSCIFPLQHSSTTDSFPDRFSAALVWGLLCCRISLPGQQESFLPVNENAVSVQKFTDHENPSLIGENRLDDLSYFFSSFLLLWSFTHLSTPLLW